MSDCVSNGGQNQLLTISIVTFNPDFHELGKTLYSLSTALAQFDTGTFFITIVDNSEKISFQHL